MITQCGPLLVHLPDAFSRYGEVVALVLTFADDILVAKKVNTSWHEQPDTCNRFVQSQIRSQVALSLLQCCLHLPADILFANHSNICKLVSLLIKHHTTTLCKHVPTVETILKRMCSLTFDHRYYCTATHCSAPAIDCLSGEEHSSNERTADRGSERYNQVP